MEEQITDQVDSCSERSKVSVVVVNYNAGTQLADCIRAVLPKAGEIIIVDNASSDSSITDCLQEFNERQGVRFICSGANLGFSAACNIGAHAAKGTYLLFLNPDCLLGPNGIPQLLNALDANADAGMVGSLLMNPYGTEQGGGRSAVPTPWRWFVYAFGLSWFEGKWPKIFLISIYTKNPCQRIQLRWKRFQIHAC